MLDFSTGTQERTKALAAAQVNQAPETGDEPAGGDVQVKPREGSELQGGGEDEVSRARLEREEEAAMVEDENRSGWIPKTCIPLGLSAEGFRCRLNVRKFTM